MYIILVRGVGSRFVRLVRLDILIKNWQKSGVEYSLRKVYRVYNSFAIFGIYSNSDSNQSGQSMIPADNSYNNSQIPAQNKSLQPNYTFQKPIEPVILQQTVQYCHCPVAEKHAL